MGIQHPLLPEDATTRTFNCTECPNRWSCSVGKEKYVLCYVIIKYRQTELDANFGLFDTKHK